MTDYEDDQLKEETPVSNVTWHSVKLMTFRFVMSSEQGRRVVWSVLEKGRVFSAISPMDAMAMAFNEGNAIWRWNCFSALWRIALNSI